MWFTDANSIGRITTGGVVTNYSGAGIRYPDAIVAGKDGALWFTNSGDNSIGRITTNGKVKTYTGIGGHQVVERQLGRGLARDHPAG
jgi:virginiamycin B lyase